MSRIFVSKADVTEVEERLVLDAVRSGWIAPLGQHADAFEAEIAGRVGVHAAPSLASAAAALHLARLGIGAGPEGAVVVPSMTCATSANVVAYAGASCVFVDARRPHGAAVDPKLLVSAIDSLRREGETVLAVMSFDLSGQAPSATKAWMPR